MIGLNELLSLKSDMLAKYKVKYVRHKDSRKEYRELIKDREELLKYQAHQSKNVFKDCDYIISFFGLDGSKSLFIGAFKVNGWYENTGEFHYDLKEIDIFDDFKDRLVVDWGKATLSWHQWVNDNDKEVVEMLPKGYLGEFPGLLNFILDFDELKQLNNNIDANKEWYHHLSSVNGVYLILDEKAGKQYIGSAYGKDGLWQRWSEYVRSGHGGNKLLKECFVNDANYGRNFKFTILQSLPSNTTNKEVINIENLYKKKLGTRLFGLNDN
ncbi:GIY-YIG nuclease family protein [Photobacterium leiognathi]|uniref:GIY-YIG nuclease family protein n=1 Tax=Photobacterium leiognathi TaxID=553611 RepID=UPI00076A6D05|nr:GIY-YIG nuclease family protein [Photobacterium leiognathi]